MLQSKSLTGESSIGFSPPSIVRETLIDTWDEPVEKVDTPVASTSSTTSVVFSISSLPYKLNEFF